MESLLDTNPVVSNKHQQSDGTLDKPSGITRLNNKNLVTTHKLTMKPVFFKLYFTHVHALKLYSCRLLTLWLRGYFEVKFVLFQT